MFLGFLALTKLPPCTLANHATAPVEALRVEQARGTLRSMTRVRRDVRPYIAIWAAAIRSAHLRLE
jgi:hypothetical protein